jgi:hypothetical protein
VRIASIAVKARLRPEGTLVRNKESLPKASG